MFRFCIFVLAIAIVYPLAAAPLIEQPIQEITPVDEFFVIQTGKTPSPLDADKWRISIKGMVWQPLTLSIADLAAMKQVEEIITVECIENPPGARLIGTGRWGGVKLQDVLDRAKVQGEPKTIVFRAVDGYSESIPYKFLQRSPVMLVTHLNGRPLTDSQGYPVRLIAPGLYGMKDIKWVDFIELISGDYEGFWEKRGWSSDAEVRIKSWIYRVDPDSENSNDRIIRGVAYAGLQKVSKVEVNTDGGNSWYDAKIDKVVGTYAWSIWSYRWVHPKKGNYNLAVRATDSAGNAQPVVDNDVLDGNNGIQSVSYTVQ